MLGLCLQQLSLWPQGHVSYGSFVVTNTVQLHLQWHLVCWQITWQSSSKVRTVSPLCVWSWRRTNGRVSVVSLVKQNLYRKFLQNSKRTVFHGQKPHHSVTAAWKTHSTLQTVFSFFQNNRVCVPRLCDGYRRVPVLLINQKTEVCDNPCQSHPMSWLNCQSGDKPQCVAMWPDFISSD